MRALCIRILRSRWTPVAGAVVLASIVPIGLASAAPGARQSVRLSNDQSGFGTMEQWVSTWAASPQTAIRGTPSDAAGFNNQTIRKIAFSSVSGDALAAFASQMPSGITPLDDSLLTIGAGSIAVAGTGGATHRGPDVPLTFGGQTSVQIPAGGWRRSATRSASTFLR